MLSLIKTIKSFLYKNIFYILELSFFFFWGVCEMSSLVLSLKNLDPVEIM